MTAVRAVRGAIQVDRDERDLIIADTRTLLEEILLRNDVAEEDIISVFFTMTPDLASGFPAAAARELGLVDVPLMCATEIAVPNALRRVVRVLAHINTDLSRSDVEHVYLRGAGRLRPDLAGGSRQFQRRTSRGGPGLSA
ncbi:MAG TPA: chorismate mutase [Actinokineospora sp.]|jgi:chorismate mutase|nr:chorismate mutase [Actinokineospora sp.]